jgi:hypothetical protein
LYIDRFYHIIGELNHVVGKWLFTLIGYV